MNTRIAMTALSVLSLAACGSDSDGDTTPAPAGTIHVRVAHLSPDAPAVDFCVKKDSGGFTGPVLKGLGVTAGLGYSQVTRYLSLDAGQYTARLVAPDAADCASSLAGLPDYPLPSLGDGTYATAAAVGLVSGSGATAFTVKPFVDESGVAAGKAALRFVHASPGTPAVDVGVLAGSDFTPVFSNVTFPTVATSAGVNANGYVVTDPISGATVSARPTGTTTDALVVPNVSLPAGAVATAFAIGQLDGPQPVAVLLCVDTAAPEGPLSSCNVVP